MVGSPEGTEGGQGAGPEEVVTLCWERKSAGRVGVNGGEGMSECPGRKRRHVQSS